MYSADARALASSSPAPHDVENDGARDTDPFDKALADYFASLESGGAELRPDEDSSSHLRELADLEPDPDLDGDEPEDTLREERPIALGER